MRTRVTLLVLVAMAAATGCSTAEEAPAAEAAAPAEPAINVRVLEVAAADLVETVTISGTLGAVRATDISSEENGVVKDIPRDRGAVVRKGQPIVQLDRELLHAERRSAEAALTLRKYNEDRARTLVDANSLSKQELLLAATELEQAKQALNVAELRYERASIKAPFDGIVVDRYVEVGQLVAAGTAVARVMDPFVLKLEGWVTEREVGWLVEGRAALITIEGLTAAVAGVVHWIGLEAHPGNGKFPVELRVNNPDLALRVGVVGRARVVKETHEAVVAVPRDAIVQSSDGSSVYVVTDDRAELHPVQLGPDEGLMVVVESGLVAGETLVVRGQRELSPGSLVAIQERSTRRDGTIDTDPLDVRAVLPEPPVESTSATSLEGSR